ncbi:NAD-dependent epimerase/dehydratase family protein [Acanthopleuribacter pedis]|uniref:NAD-dependent epimerase/dehydratase family protein n=1 Tax=Acanthopleuribacter pedis TaxID=442870 RepID=A0A8J7QEM7_9BACT|nr:NAD-dependent epimerase/dehydratase family protein [Acanthopleuribacter pedis]MBO1322549.1 NAD-dependent epimerase/dehydratase family protein [Acanthopleuribacter pedis]
MTQINRSAPVMVTGATGYVAGVLVKKLLQAGFTVHAPVRDPHNTDKLKYLNALAAESTGNIKYFKADLLETGSYAEAMAGCELVFHTASPFKVNVKDPQKELVDPAKLGTRNVLEQANQTPSVKRVVLTSSCAAIYGDNIDLQQTPDGVFTEEIWNTSSSLAHNPYSYSKTLAEKEAWRIGDLQSQWDLVVINPTLVIGPGINPHGTSESFNIIRHIGDGTFSAGVPHWGFGVVDVRDLAEAHFRAGFTPHAKGRHIISAHNTDMFAMSQTLLPRFGQNYPIPRKTVPKWLLWLVGPLVDKTMTRKMIGRNVNYPWRGDNSKSKRELGVSYRPLADSMNAFFQQMVHHGLLNKVG